MRALVIDPVKFTVEEVEYDNKLATAYRLLSDPENGIECDLVQPVSIDDKNDIYVDEEGLLKNPQHFFMIDSYPDPLAGRGLVIGAPDRRGNTTAAKISLEDMRRKVIWLRLNADRRLVVA